MTNEHPFRAELDSLATLINFTEPDLIASDFSFALNHIQPYYFLVIATWVKTLKTTKSIHLLCENGLSRDAEALLRVLTESLVNLHYLCADDQDKRTRWYFDYLSITNKKMDGVIAGSSRLKTIADKIRPESRREVQRQYEEVMLRRSEKGLDWFQKLISRLGIFRHWWPGAKSWSGYSTETMAKKVGLHNFYDLIYRMASETIHGTDLIKHLELIDKTGFDLTKGVHAVYKPDDEVTKETLVSANIGFYLVLESVYTTLEHKRLAELKAQFEKLKAAFPTPD